MSRVRQVRPTPVSEAVFGLKRALLSARRSVAELSAPPPRHSKASIEDFGWVAAESRSPLFSTVLPAERPLELGKVQNLRIACAKLNNVVIPKGQVFSFWAQIGRCKGANGYVLGRELKEGCLVPAVGGGLCQLSNAIYTVALKAGAEIVERHSHTAEVPDSAFKLGQDATVAWNYVDLRFMPGVELMLTARLDERDLVVALRARVQPERPTWSPGSSALLLRQPRAARSCASCGEADCHRHEIASPLEGQQSAFLVDELWPEFDRYLLETRSESTELHIPIDGSRFHKQSYAWSISGYRRVRGSTLQTLSASFRSRSLAPQGAERQKALLQRSRELAESYGRRLSPEATHCVVSLNLLPFLWEGGWLGGRSFDVLMTRQPISVLQETLDRAASEHPERSLLTDFRAPASIARDESEALNGARKLVTPHTFICADDPRRVLIEWSRPRPSAVRAGPRVCFLGPTVARKGSYELRDALRGIECVLVTLGPQLEGPSFWDGFCTTPAGEDWLEDVHVVVQPALIEDKPRKLLLALESGRKVIATPNCGLPDHANLSLVPAGDPNQLRAAMLRCLE